MSNNRGYGTSGIVASGACRSRIRFEEAVETSNAVGDTSIGWSEVATVWASISPRSGQEDQRSQQVQSGQKWDVECRWHTGLAVVSTKHRIVWGDKVLAINSIVSNPGFNRTLSLACEEGR